MSFRLNGKLAITLLFALALLLALASPSSANAISPDPLRRRDHPNINRMIKIRAAAPPVARASLNLGAIGAGANPPDENSTPSTPSNTPSTPSHSDTQSASATPSSGQSNLPLTSLSTSAVESASSTLSRSSASSTSSTASTQTTTSSTSTSSTTSTSTTPSTLRNAASPTNNGASASVDSVTLTSHVAAASSSSTSNSQIGASNLSRTTITILIVLAASIGGCAIIWTIIRKWKFRPSAHFDERLEPVNWQPAEHDGTSGLPTHRRVPSNASSFHSAGHDNMGGLARSNSGGVYNAGRSLSPLPDHDFTAGAAALAPGGGYADLARGPSPQPHMQEALNHGPSFNRGYNDYAAPAHYQGSQDAYDYNSAGPRY